MKQKFLFGMAAVAIVTLSCQKEVSTEQKVNELSPPKANAAVINGDKNERAILFISDRDGDYEVFAMNHDGTNVVQLTSNSYADGRATWSANGQHIAFAAGSGNKDIYVMNANTSGLRNITNTPLADEDWPEWSPAGNRLVFSSNRNGNHEIYLYDFDDESLTRLTVRTQDDKWPTFSPDGSKIAFQSDMGTSLGRTDVFVMDANGTGVTRLTSNAAFDQMPTWSPDGSKIAFMSARDGNPNIYLMNADGSGQTALTTNAAADARPSWSRHAGKIIFSSTRNGGKWNIYSMNPDGSNQSAVTTQTSYNNDYPYSK